MVPHEFDPSDEVSLKRRHGGSDEAINAFRLLGLLLLLNHSERLDFPSVESLSAFFVVNGSEFIENFLLRFCQSNSLSQHPDHPFQV